MNDSWEFENENVTAEVRVWVVRGLKQRITHTSLLGVRIDLFPLAASYKTLKKKKSLINVGGNSSPRSNCEPYKTAGVIIPNGSSFGLFKEQGASENHR